MGWIDDKINSGDKLTAKMLYDKFGFQHVIGIHVYGKTAIAGPACVVGIIIKPNHRFDLKTSDKLSLAECEKLSYAIRRKSTMLTMAWVSVENMFNLGMQEAIMQGINSCLIGVSIYNPPSILIVDGFKMNSIPNGIRQARTPLYTVSKGRERVDIITAANIVARVGRETMMKFAHQEYPEYDWINNGGFATAQHIGLIKEYGISPLHRDLSNVKALKDFAAFPNERWRKRNENRYFGE